jgi:hypothetical protein
VACMAGQFRFFADYINMWLLQLLSNTKAASSYGRGYDAVISQSGLIAYLLRGAISSFDAITITIFIFYFTL